MNLGRVCGQVVSTKKSENLMGFKILIVQPISLETFEEKGAPVVSIDTIGAGEGEVVMMVSGSSARQTAITDAKPTDNSIVAIIDSVDIGGKRVFDKADPSIKMEKEEPKEEVPTIDAVLKEEAPAEEPVPEVAEETEAIEEEEAEEAEAEAEPEAEIAEEAEIEAEPETEPEAEPAEEFAEEFVEEFAEDAEEEFAEEQPAEAPKAELKLFMESDVNEERTKAQQAAAKRARRLIEQKLAEKEDAEK